MRFVVDDAVPLLFGYALYSGYTEGAGIVYEDVNGAEMLLDLLNSAAGVTGLVKVTNDGHCTLAFPCASSANDGLQSLLTAAEDSNFRSFAAKGQGDGTADARAAAGHDRHFVFEACHDNVTFASKRCTIPPEIYLQLAVRATLASGFATSQAKPSRQC